MGNFLESVRAFIADKPEEAKDYRPTVVFVNEDNSISRITSYEKHGEIG